MENPGILKEKVTYLRKFPPSPIAILIFRAEAKLLKPNCSYPLGRKGKDPLQLVLSHPKVSAEHVIFTVGDHPLNNIVSPSSVLGPRLYLMSSG